MELFMRVSSLGNPPTIASVWHDVSQDTLDWVTDWKEGHAFVAWVGA